MSSYYVVQNNSYKATGLVVGPASSATANASLVGTDTSTSKYALITGGTSAAAANTGYLRVRNDGRIEWNHVSGAAFNIQHANAVINGTDTSAFTLTNGILSDKGQLQFPAADTGAVAFTIGLPTANQPSFRFSGSLSYQGYVVAKTSNYTVTLADTGTIFTNTGAVGAVQFTIPAVNVSLQYTFIATAAQVITVTGPSQIFGAGSLTGTTRTLTGSTGAQQYSAMTIVGHDHNGYYIVDGYGTIT